MATHDDFARVAALTVAAYRTGDLPDDSHYWTYLHDTAQRAGAPNEIWVAQLDGLVVGSLTWCPPGSADLDTAEEGECEFRTLAVDPAARGQGVARALVTAVIDRARSEQLPAIAITTADWMQSAHRLYESLGFVRTPQRDWVIEGQTLLTYRLALTEPTP